MKNLLTHEQLKELPAGTELIEVERNIQDNSIRETRCKITSREYVGYGMTYEHLTEYTPMQDMHLVGFKLAEVK